MANIDIRKEAKTAGIPFWKIADVLGVCDMTLSRKLRRELSETEKSRIRDIIAQLVKGREPSA